MEISKKMSKLSSAVFTELNNKKMELIAKGLEVIDFSIGTPDIPPSPRLIEIFVNEASKLENYVYAISDKDELIASVIKWYKKRYKVDLDKEEIVSLLGSQSGFGEIALTLLNPGDLVLIPDPGYPIFKIGPLIAGAKIHTMPLTKENNYIIDLDGIDPIIAKEAKLMIVSYPNNPTGAIASLDFYKKLVAFAKKYNIIVLHDNAYSELIFDGNIGISFLSIPGARDIGIEFNSLSKTFSIPGCRIAFALGNRTIIHGLKTLKSHLDYGMFLPFQKVAIEALDNGDAYVSYVRDTYLKRRNLLIEGLKDIGWSIDYSGGTMFVWAPIPSNYKNSFDFTMDLLDKTGVIVVPGSSFGEEGEGYVRIALVQTEENILKAINNIKNSNIFR